MRVFGYTRVSKEKDGQVSPEAQRDEIERFCSLKDWAVVEWFSDSDVSASRTTYTERPALAEMLRRAEDGECDVVVFYRLDRMARNPADHYAILASLQTSGVRVDSVTLPHDDSPEGEFVWDLSAALNKLESRRLGQRLRSMHRRLASQGAYGGNLPPFGWVRVRDEDGSQRIVLEPEEARWRRQAHEWYWRGWSLARIADALNAAEVPTRRGARWSAGSVRKMLSAPVQTGIRMVDGEPVSTGRIEPLLTEKEYAQTLAVTASRRAAHYHPRRAPRFALRGDLVVCGSCGGPMYLRYTVTRAAAYTCEGTTKRTCTKPCSIREHILRGLVEEKLHSRLRTLRPSRRPRKEPEDIPRLSDEQRRLTHSLGRLAAMYAEGELAQAEYHVAREGQLAKLARVDERLEAAYLSAESAALSLTDEDAARLRTITPEVWAALPVDVQHDIYRVLVDRIVVNRADTEPRVRVFWR